MMNCRHGAGWGARLMVLSLVIVVLGGLVGSAQAGEKLVRIKVAQYKNALDFVCPKGGSWSIGELRGLLTGSEKCRIEGTLSTAAKKRFHVMVASVPKREPDKVAQTIAKWQSLGWTVHTLEMGKPVYGSDGQTVVYDGRVVMIGVGVYDDQHSAQTMVDKVAAAGYSSWIHRQVLRLASGDVRFLVNGTQVGQGEELLIMPKETLTLRKVEYAVGYPWHGFEDRTYRGVLSCRWGAEDALDCVLKTDLELIVAGVVPSEISYKAEIGALRAQAVAARGEILGKIGLRHADEGFDTCSEQHCQVFKGETVYSQAVAQKIAPTSGCVLVNPKGGILDAVYSANCGGHSEANHLVWTTQPDPILGGLWDHPAPVPALDLTEEEQMGRFIRNPPPCYCNNPAVEGGTKFRWTEAITAAEWREVEGKLGIGRIKTVTDIARGVSGRIYQMTFLGQTGTKTIMKELNIRRLFGSLKSAAFVAEWTRDSAGWITGGTLLGAGFGHGVGMCQTGAQALAKKGWSFERILAHYFPGSVLKKWY